MARTNQPAQPTDGTTDLSAPQDAPQDGAPAAETPAEASPPKTTATIMVQLPVALKDLIDARAEAEKLNTAAFVRGLLARTVEYTLPLPEPRGRKSKYAGMSAADAKTAKAADASERNKKVKALFAAIRNKDIDIEAILAKYAADNKAEAAAEKPVTEGELVAPV